MKVLFLDIDGVLNTDSFRRNVEIKDDLTDEQKSVVVLNKYEESAKIALFLIDPVLVENLNVLIKLANIDGVIISSNWRKNFSFQFIEAALIHHGLKGKIIGETPHWVTGQRFSEILPKGREIKEWLDNNINVKKFIILDDDNIFHGMKQLDGFFRTHPSEGLTENLINKIIDKEKSGTP